MNNEKPTDPFDRLVDAVLDCIQRGMLLAAEGRADHAALQAAWESERRRLREDLRLTYDEQRIAGEKCGVSFDTWGCKWAGAVADHVVWLQSEVERLNATARLAEDRAEKYKQDAIKARQEKEGAARPAAKLGWLKQGVHLHSSDERYFLRCWEGEAYLPVAKYRTLSQTAMPLDAAKFLCEQDAARGAGPLLAEKDAEIASLRVERKEANARADGAQRYISNANERINELTAEVARLKAECDNAMAQVAAADPALTAGMLGLELTDEQASDAKLAEPAPMEVYFGPDDLKEGQSRLSSCKRFGVSRSNHGFDVACARCCATTFSFPWSGVIYWATRHAATCEKCKGGGA